MFSQTMSRPLIRYHYGIYNTACQGKPLKFYGFLVEICFQKWKPGHIFRENVEKQKKILEKDRMRHKK